METACTGFSKAYGSFMRTILIAIVALLAVLGGALAYTTFLRPALFSGQSVSAPAPAIGAFRADARPDGQGALLFDYAGLLSGQEEGVNRYLNSLRDAYGIEGVVVTLPSLKQTGLPEEAWQGAFKLFNAWDIGRRHDGRGVLVLLVEDTQDVKVEVGMALEGVFTDLFTGYAENRQLKGHMQTGTVGHGLVAILEEFERRAEVESRSGPVGDTIRNMDRKLLSMGAGAQRNTSEFAGRTASSKSRFVRGAKTPEEAWAVIVSKFRGEGKYHDVDILTDASKLITGDQNALNYGWINDYAANRFEARAAGDYAVISFGRKKGWDHDPVFLMWTDTPPGWKNDMVSMRKYNVRGKAPDWMIERGDHPYIGLTSYAYWSMGKDIPKDPEDIYTADNDAEFAALYKALKSAGTHDFATQMELGRLGVVMALLPQDIHPHLDAAAKLAPESPLPHKYRAIVAIESNYQYETALKEMNTYLDKGGAPEYGYNFIGYLHYRQGRYLKALDALGKAMDAYGRAGSAPPAYTLDKLIRTHAGLSADGKRSRAQRDADMLEAYRLFTALTDAYPGHYRAAWLTPVLKEKNILGNPDIETRAARSKASGGGGK